MGKSVRYIHNKGQNIRDNSDVRSVTCLTLEISLHFSRSQFLLKNTLISLPVLKFLQSIRTFPLPLTKRCLIPGCFSPNFKLDEHSCTSMLCLGWNLKTVVTKLILMIYVSIHEPNSSVICADSQPSCYGKGALLKPGSKSHIATRTLCNSLLCQL